jgi:hypothetical protein
VSGVASAGSSGGSFLPYASSWAYLSLGSGTAAKAVTMEARAGGRGAVPAAGVACGGGTAGCVPGMPRAGWHSSPPTPPPRHAPRPWTA